MMIKVIKDPEKNEGSGKEPGWIDKEYGLIFLEGLPAEIPPTRAGDHQIPVNQDIIQMNNDTNVQHISEDLIHESLKCYWDIDQSK